MIHDGSWCILGGIGRYLVVLGQYGAELVGTWYWVSVTWYCSVISGTGLVKGFMPVCIETSADLVGCYHSRKNNDERKGKIELLSHWTMDG